MRTNFKIEGPPRAQLEFRASFKNSRRGARMNGISIPSPMEVHYPTPKMIDPSSAEKKAFAIQAKKHAPKSPPFGPVAIYLTFYFKRPDEHYDSQGRINKGSPVHFEAKPDIDDLIKFVMDALKGLFYYDDNQVIECTASKRWHEYDATAVEVFTINNAVQ